MFVKMMHSPIDGFVRERFAFTIIRSFLTRNRSVNNSFRSIVMVMFNNESFGNYSFIWQLGPSVVRIESYTSRLN